VGLTSALLADANNIGFAIPINLVKQVLPQLVQQGRVIRPWLGVSGKVIGREVQDLLKLPLVDGFLVETIEPGSPAAKAGLHEGELLIAISGEEFLFGGDIITAANGQVFDDTEKFAQFVRALKVGDTVHLTLYHDGSTREVEFTLPERPILPSDVPPDSRRALAPLRSRRAPLPLGRARGRAGAGVAE
jgi:S1-C subfamily serine protease